VNLIKDFELKDASSAVEDLTKIYDGMNVIAARQLTTESMQISLTQNISVYDSLYIAATQKTNGTLYTADNKLCNAANLISATKLLKP